LLGSFAGNFGWTATFGLIAAITGVGGICWLMGAKYLRRDTELAPHRA
jgi:hypothetical protein